ncbi:MAG: NAD(P)(+) transhydrogenase (Re/Si-specific) subunit beta [Gammaproteobacteria bacterium]|mgnify:FL=1|nr:MAG: NAD(P)(+) transhydrogenase (Re/Si-specific) subunit beta [Gammaproteobacteria bacterium]
MYINLCYFITAIVFIIGLKKMSSPKTAANGIRWAGAAMILATLVTFFPGALHSVSQDSRFANYVLVVLALGVGGGLAWVSGKKVKTTDLPQMIALYNGLGGGAAAAIAAVELMRYNSMVSSIGNQAQEAQSQLGDKLLASVDKVSGAVQQITNGSQQVIESAVNQVTDKFYADNGTAITLAVVGALIGTVAFSGSIIAWAKLDGRMKKSIEIPSRNLVNLALFAAIILFGIVVIKSCSLFALFLFFVLTLVFGVLVTVPIGGADMPVIISLFNALTGLAVAFEGLVIGNAAMMIAGTVVGSAGTLLTQLMAKAMNRSLANVLFSGFGNSESGAVAEETEGSMKEIDAEDVGVMMAYAEQVVIVPGYGMAVAQAQHKIWELSKMLIEKGVKVKFAIHPVAGRMPGHMNVLLAEAGVPYDVIYDMEDINADFNKTQVALVIGANDVVNPSARTDTTSEIYGMPILDVDNADNVIVIKRGRGKGFSGIENPLFFADNTRMLFGDGQKMAEELIQALKEL